jgi:hypothetical protein
MRTEIPQPETDAIVAAYAERYVEKYDGAETVAEYSEQAALDVGQPSIKQKVMAAIRQMQRRTECQNR